ncbi:P-loop containing nucleoside triphosphate hydrolase protein [Zychaea mexicana]|uniref:P-loop containing nucleoside triphosphate hydrolase protein n=1 Tax=Zychaea mexicana TaxID=64656 RepID=UPI0022FED132|nr:P-loop containing nucleoside triphosphate hydrolase protein [Zychaea mexicana]KAI9496993.1 P-loop containing nucleoside triphosphate hydrolase protein [Zychaea mexicana]
MTALSKTFLSKLQQFDVELDEDTFEYIAGMLNDLDLTDDDVNTAIQESTEDFLKDANIAASKRNQFYKALSEDLAFSTTTPLATATATVIKQTQDGPVALPTTAAKNTGTLAAKDSNNGDYGDTTSNSVTQEDVKSSGRARRTRGGRRKQQQQQEPDQQGDVEPNIVATSQQSRFHTETLETSSAEIDLPGVNISVNMNDLLVDAHLKLKEGIRYGLVGQNGVGKTMLMRCLADNILVGLPQNINILHVAQLQVLDETKTVLDEVMSADRKTINTLREAKALQEVLGAGGKQKEATAQLNCVVYDLMVARSLERLDMATKLATKRSGARGREARREQILREKEHEELTAKNPQTAVSAENANSMVAEVFEKLELIDVGANEAKAKKILLGIGFSKDQLESPVSIFSGGWRMKIALAKSLFMDPDILLLDEPTNHLDLPAILWLQEYLINETDGQTIVIVSHDRAFLANVTDETIIIRDKQLKYHGGSYDDWERNTEEQRTRKQTLLDNQERRKKQIMASIQHNRQQAKSTGDDKRHGMIASRQKKLERLGMEKTEDGKRFKQSYRAGFHDDMREKIVVEKAVKTAAIKIPDPPPLRYSGSVFSMRSVTFKYPGTKEKMIDNFSIDIELGSRTVLLGSNGSGKTTLLNLLVGRLSPTSGEVYRHPLLRVGYFSQHVVDELDENDTPVEALMKLQENNKSEQECRQHLGSIGMSGPVALRQIKFLSGGQRNRVALAFILFQAPHVLILDEITNHLDMGTVEALTDALAGYSGAIVAVSHDVWFLKQLMEEQTADEAEGDPADEVAAVKSAYYLVQRGKPIKRWEKGIDDYVAKVLKTVRKSS